MHQRTAINSQKMKLNNRSMVLDCVRRHGALSRADLRELLGLMPATITNIVGTLIEEGMLKETHAVPSARGRRPMMLQLRTDSFFAVGAQLSTHRMTCVITDLYGNILAGERAAVDLRQGIDPVVARLSAFILDTLRRAGIAKEAVLQIGLVSAGPYDHARGIMINPPNFTGWHNVPICEMVSRHTGIPSVFEKDTVGLTLAEYWCGQARDVDSLFGVSVEEAGIGGGILLRGEVYHGLGDSAGDIGHAPVEMEGRLCTCGNRGCLETVASGFSMMRILQDRLRESGDTRAPHPPEPLTLEAMLQAANEGREPCLAVVRQAARMVAFSLAQAVHVISPDRIVVGGYVPALCPVFFETVKETLEARGYPLFAQGTKVMRATFGEMQVALGGAGLVLQHLFQAA